ncbi:MAG TPA: preprotein translocase subunit SecG [Terriglobia bacterium]|nr:preprotein translocase subunit SecG [Terriglobia bacterium]
MIVVLVVHILIAAFLVGIILVQKNEGGLGGLGGSSGSGGMGGLLAGRTQANLLTRTTAVLATAFFVTSIALATFSSRGGHNVLVPEVNQPAGNASQPLAPLNTPNPALPETGGSAPAAPAPTTSAPAVPAQPEPAKPAAPAGQ